jgi:hypothetical protein
VVAPRLLPNPEEFHLVLFTSTYVVLPEGNHLDPILAGNANQGSIRSFVRERIVGNISCFCCLQSSCIPTATSALSPQSSQRHNTEAEKSSLKVPKPTPLSRSMSTLNTINATQLHTLVCPYSLYRLTRILPLEAQCHASDTSVPRKI